MFKINYLLGVSLVTLVLPGCASRASSVPPAAVSAIEYSGMSCEETRGELSAARERNNALTRKQNNAATADAVSIAFVFFPLGSVLGNDVSGELALAKGEVGALERAIKINCRTETVALDAN